MKQEVNRKHAADKWALDDVVMVTEVCTQLAVNVAAIADAACQLWGGGMMPVFSSNAGN